MDAEHRGPSRRFRTVVQESPAAEDQLRCQLAPHSRIKVIGLGGIGCIVVEYLSLFLKSLDIPVRLVLIDGDRFEAKNASRMHFRAQGNKAETKAREIIDKLGPCSVSVVAVPKYVTQRNVARLVRPRDYLILCVDNHPTRKLISAHCERLSDIILFSGGNEGVDPPRERGSYGNVSIHIRQGGKNLTAPITRYHPEILRGEGKMPDEPDCAQLAVSSPQILFTNLAVASALLSALFSFTCGRLDYQELMLDVLDARMLPQLPINIE